MLKLVSATALVYSDISWCYPRILRPGFAILHSLLIMISPRSFHLPSHRVEVLPNGCTALILWVLDCTRLPVRAPEVLLLRLKAPSRVRLWPFLLWMGVLWTRWASKAAYLLRFLLPAFISVIFVVSLQLSPRKPLSWLQQWSLMLLYSVIPTSLLLKCMRVCCSLIVSAGNGREYRSFGRLNTRVTCRTSGVYGVTACKTSWQLFEHFPHSKPSFCSCFHHTCSLAWCQLEALVLVDFDSLDAWRCCTVYRGVPLQCLSAPFQATRSATHCLKPLLASYPNVHRQLWCSCASCSESHAVYCKLQSVTIPFTSRCYRS